MVLQMVALLVSEKADKSVHTKVVPKVVLKVVSLEQWMAEWLVLLWDIL